MIRYLKIASLAACLLISACMQTYPHLKRLTKYRYIVNSPTPNQPVVVYLKRMLAARIPHQSTTTHTPIIYLNLSRATWHTPHPGTWNGLIARTLSYSLQLNLSIKKGQTTLMKKKTIIASRSITQNANQLTQPADYFIIKNRLNQQAANLLWASVLVNVK